MPRTSSKAKDVMYIEGVLNTTAVKDLADLAGKGRKTVSANLLARLADGTCPQADDGRKACVPQTLANHEASQFKSNQNMKAYESYMNHI